MPFVVRARETPTSLASLKALSTASSMALDKPDGDAGGRAVVKLGVVDRRVGRTAMAQAQPRRPADDHDAQNGREDRQPPDPATMGRAPASTVSDAGVTTAAVRFNTWKSPTRR